MDELLNQISHDEYLFKIDCFMESAWIGHAPFLKFLIREQKPEIFVELGVHNGFSYFLGCQSIKENNLTTKAFAIDHWNGDSQAGFFDDSVYNSVKSVNSKFSDFSSLIKSSFNEALSEFEDNSIDLLHIDGFHSYESVKEDFFNWLPKVSTQGIILLHDIHVRRNSFGVYRLWKEIKNNYRTMEFVNSHGLGVIFLGETPKGNLGELLEIVNAGLMGDVQGTFGSISDDVLQASKSTTLSSALVQRDEALVQRDEALVQRDEALVQRDEVINSTIWKLSNPYRKIKQFIFKY